MTDVVAARGAAGPELPPGFSLVRIPGGAGAFAWACRCAGRDGAGTFVWSSGADVLDLAVVLEPDEPLRTARRAFSVGMAALLDALGSVAPPDKPLVVEWPGTILFDGARLGGGRLGSPEGCAEDAVPDWLVFSAALIVSKQTAGEPGLTPESTSLEEEGVPSEDLDRVAEVFARHLLRNFAILREDGFEPAAASYFARLAGSRPGLSDPFGLNVDDGSPSGCGLGDALREPDWLDLETGMPRL